MAFPSRRRIRVSPDVNLSVLDVPPAEPADNSQTLLFIHGAAGHLIHWKYMMEHFSQHHRTVAMDLRGHGESDKPESTYALEELVDDLDALVAELQLPERFDLVAHSFGGALALTYAMRHPERLRKMVLISTSALIPLTRLWRPLLTLPTALIEPVRRMVAAKVCCPTHVLKQFLPGTVYTWNGWNLLEQIVTPTLVIIAENDKTIPPSYTRRMADKIPGSRVEIIRHSRHLPILERPAAVNRAMDRFLTEQVKSWRGSLETPQT